MLAFMLRRYEVHEGKIQTEWCEVNVTHHCNLACKGCDHLSPIAAKSLIAPAEVERDLAILARVYHARAVKLLGGEPLLHPGLLDVVSAVRRSGVSDGVTMVTNGKLLAKAPDALWEALDQVLVSSYPGHRLEGDELAFCEAKARTFGVHFWVNRVEEFRMSLALKGTDDERLRKRVYQECSIAHTWRCHTVAEGHFFKCPPSYFFPRQFGPRAIDPYEDGLRLVDEPGFGERLLAYLESEEPLTTCGRCLGTSGVAFEHHQAKRREWLDGHDVEAEALFDAGTRRAAALDRVARVKPRPVEAAAALR